MAKETEEYESTQESLARNAGIRSLDLIRLSDENGYDDSGLSTEDSIDKESSQSLILHSQNTDPDSSNVETSQSIIPHSEEQGLRLTEINLTKGDEVEVHIRKERNGRLLTSVGRVKRVDPDCPNRVRLEGCKNYREVLRIITRHSTSMNSNDIIPRIKYCILS
jgi:hypothetical protein